MKEQIYTFLLGTAAILDVSKEAGIRHFIYCSSMSGVIGHCGINEGTNIYFSSRNSCSTRY